MGISLTARDPDKVKIWGERISRCRESGESVTQWCEEGRYKKGGAEAPLDE